mmetsp:Transcript_115500/g.274506  ORF Transcript_115500/g.274506 Transcript_115500/m.274506 type:complete len:230 (+) Transcript_115500:452-1141(+)
MHRYHLRPHDHHLPALREPGGPRLGLLQPALHGPHFGSGGGGRPAGACLVPGPTTPHLSARGGLHAHHVRGAVLPAEGAVQADAGGTSPGLCARPLPGDKNQGGCQQAQAEGPRRGRLGVRWPLGQTHAALRQREGGVKDLERRQLGAAVEGGAAAGASSSQAVRGRAEHRDQEPAGGRGTAQRLGRAAEGLAENGAGGGGEAMQGAGGPGEQFDQSQREVGSPSQDRR